MNLFGVCWYDSQCALYFYFTSSRLGSPLNSESFTHMSTHWGLLPIISRHMNHTVSTNYMGPFTHYYAVLYLINININWQRAVVPLCGRCNLQILWKSGNLDISRPERVIAKVNSLSIMDAGSFAFIQMSVVCNR